jgi:hypothetical protein
VQGAPAGKTGGNAVKIILIVVAVLVGLGILGTAAMTYVGYRIAKGSHVSQDGKNVTVETPFGKVKTEQDAEGKNVRVETPYGTVETNQDPNEVARRLGVDMYPGAKMKEGGTVTGAMGGGGTSVTATLETDDSVEKVADFYKSRFPNAHMSQTGHDQFSLVAGDQSRMTMINAVGVEGKTQISIQVVRGASGQQTQ